MFDIVLETYALETPIQLKAPLKVGGFQSAKGSSIAPMSSKALARAEFLLRDIMDSTASFNTYDVKVNKPDAISTPAPAALYHTRSIQFF